MFPPSPNQKRIAWPVDLAAAENLTPFFFDVLSKLGLELVIVQFKAGEFSPIWEHAGLDRVLEQELQAVQAGQFDSETYTPGSRWLFFHAADLGKAMQTLKRALEARGLLEITTLLHCETATELRVWHPATADLVNIEDEAEA